MSLPSRLDAKITRTATCWLWTAATNDDGYGLAWSEGSMRMAHRVVWKILVGPLADDVELDHQCHVRSCVRPEHLVPKDHAGNQANRAGATRGSQTGVLNVYWIASRSRFVVEVRRRGRKHSGGAHTSLEDATRAADELRAHLALTT